METLSGIRLNLICPQAITWNWHQDRGFLRKFPKRKVDFNSGHEGPCYHHGQEFRDGSKWDTDWVYWEKGRSTHSGRQDGVWVWERNALATFQLGIFIPVDSIVQRRGLRGCFQPSIVLVTGRINHCLPGAIIFFFVFDENLLIISPPEKFIVLLVECRQYLTVVTLRVWWPTRCIDEVIRSSR